MSKLSKKKVFKTLDEFKSVTPELLEKITSKQLGISDIATMDADVLIELLLIDQKKAEKLIAEAKKNICFQFENLETLLRRRQSILKLKTGSENLDALLDGGIETQTIFEVFGESTSGKTHLMHQLTVCALRSVAEGGLNGSVLYLDTEATFRPEKILNIAKRIGVQESVLLKNIVYIRIGSSAQQKLSLEEVFENPASLGQYVELPEKPLKLVIIDSIISHLRAEYLGRGRLAERQQVLSSILSNCLKFTRRHNGIVCVTNQITNNPDAALFASPIKAAGGAILSHATSYRLYIRKGRETKRIIKVIDAPNLPQHETVVELTSEGII